MTKSETVVANINARAAISSALSTRSIFNKLRVVDELEQGTIEMAVQKAWAIGFDAGAKDAMEGDD